MELLLPPKQTNFSSLALWRTPFCTHQRPVLARNVSPPKSQHYCCHLSSRTILSGPLLYSIGYLALLLSSPKTITAWSHQRNNNNNNNSIDAYRSLRIHQLAKSKSRILHFPLCRQNQRRPLTAMAPPNNLPETSKSLEEEALDAEESPKRRPKRTTRSPKKSEVEPMKKTAKKGKPPPGTSSSDEKASTAASSSKKPQTAKKQVKRKKAAAKEELQSDASFEEEKVAAASGAKKKKKKSRSVQEETKPQREATKAAKEEPQTDVSSPKKVAKKKTPSHQVLTERDELPKLWDKEKEEASGSYTFRVASWNVAGLRALVRKSPTALADLVQKYDLDVLCLQETKLQEQHLNDAKLNIPRLEEEGYQAYYTCSTAKKGYSGTAVFIRQQGKTKSKQKKQATMDSFMAAGGKKTKVAPKKLTVDVKDLVHEQVTFQLGVEKHDAEGRVVCMDFPLFTMVNLYVPNSGQKLERLQYRTDEWDKDLLAFVQKKQKERGLPVLWLGDLNVAHTALEVWNDGATHLAKQAGVTAEERASFQEQLDAGFVDAFRQLHGPGAKGHYSYWSMRAGNRPVNKGLRLDYFICDPAFFDETSRVVARDSFMIYDQDGSDHCPVVLELEIKQTP